MASCKEILRSGHIHVSLALGISIIVLAYVSKRMLPAPMEPIYLSMTSLLMAGYEAVENRKKYKRFAKSWCWVLSIFAATVVIIFIHVV